MRLYSEMRENDVFFHPDFQVQRICMKQRLHIAYAIVYTQYIIQPLYCQIGNTISLLLNFVNFDVLEA